MLPKLYLTVAAYHGTVAIVRNITLSIIIVIIFTMIILNLANHYQTVRDTLWRKLRSLTPA